MKLQKLYSKVRQALDDYNMITENDKIAIGVSGGKDSLTLLYALSGELLKELKPAEIQAFFKAYLDRIYRMHPEVPYEITHEDKISDASKEIIDEAARAVLAEWEEAARESSEAAAQSENAQGENAQGEAALKPAEVSEAAEK